MSKIRKLDFIISEKDDDRLVFRFYPRQSNCHSFNDERPSSWENVYKVCYSYAILNQYRLNPDDTWKTEKVFECMCDECSIINEVGLACVELASGRTQKVFECEIKKQVCNYLNERIQPLGDGVDWIINKYDNQWAYDNLPGTKYQEYYEFILWRYDNVGYKFTLESERIKEFGEYLKRCCEYMFAHGYPV